MSNRFIAIQHNWHVHSDGFKVHELKADNEKDAYTEACVIESEGNDRFSRCAVVVVAIGDNESLISRKLNLLERLTGKLMI